MLLPCIKECDKTVPKIQFGTVDCELKRDAAMQCRLRWHLEQRLINHSCHSDATQASLLLCTVSHPTLVTNIFLATEESGWEYLSVYQSKYEINAITIGAYFV